MLRIVKRLLKIRFTYQELRRIVAPALANPPFPTEFSRQASGVTNAEGVSFPDVWRSRFNAELQYVANRPDWSAQRVAALDGLVNNSYWLAVYAASRGAKNPESWSVFVAHDADFKDRPFAKWEVMLLQKMLVAAATTQALVTVLEQGYGFDKFKSLEVQLYFETEKHTMETRIQLLDRLYVLSEDPQVEADVVRVQAAQFDEVIAPQLDRERRLADVLREEILYRSVDIAACRNQLDELEGQRHALAQQLRESA